MMIVIGKDVSDKLIKLTRVTFKPDTSIEYEEDVDTDLVTGLVRTFLTLNYTEFRFFTSTMSCFYAFSPFKQHAKICKVNYENCQRLRQFCREIVQERRSGRMKSEMKGNSDIISLLFDA